MGMGRRFVAHLRGPSASPLAKSVAATVGIVLAIAAFGWFVSIAPAAVSFAVAVGAAVAWCAWLEKHPEAPASSAALEGLFRHFLVPLQARMPIVEARRSERHGHERGQRQSGSYTDGRFEGQ
jgi:hypothetical protein